MLPNLEGGEHNEETDRLFAYHQATKHTYQSVRANARFLDWNNQPNPFRTYDGAPVVPLTIDPGFPAASTFATMGELAGKHDPSSDQLHPASGKSVRLGANLISQLLWHSMAVSAWKKSPGGRYSLRVNPSSGNLHPTETYLAVTGFAGIESGLYHYRADLHALELRNRGAWTQHLANALDLGWNSRPALIIGLTSIFWREAWKYGNRAYRYCCHDLGHAMMSLLLAAQALGMPGGAVTHFSDLRLARVLGLSESDEAPMAFLVFETAHDGDSIGDIPDGKFLGAPNELSREEVPYHLLLGMHRSTILPDPRGSPPVVVDDESSRMPLGAGAAETSSSHPERDTLLAPIVRQRRSALDFDPAGPQLRREELHQLLDFATRDWHADWRGNFNGGIGSFKNGADLVTLYLYVHRVRDWEPGIYRWQRSKNSLEQLHVANVERIAAYLSLEQTLAGNACFAVSMIGNLGDAAKKFGNRGYRLVHFEAGAIGQRLYLGAEALSFRATGIGAFYDDDVHRYLGFLGEEKSPVEATIREAERATTVNLDALKKIQPSASASQLHSAESIASPITDSRFLPQQVIYHFAVGTPVLDPRIEA